MRPIPRGEGRLLVLSSYYALGVCPLHSIITGNGVNGSRYSCNQDWGVVNHTWSNNPMGLLMFHLKYSISSEQFCGTYYRKCQSEKINEPVWFCYMKMTIQPRRWRINKAFGPYMLLTRHRGQALIGTWKATFHWWVCNCSKVWWLCVALFSL